MRFVFANRTFRFSFFCNNLSKKLCYSKIFFVKKSSSFQIFVHFKFHPNLFSHFTEVKLTQAKSAIFFKIGHQIQIYSFGNSKLTILCRYIQVHCYNLFGRPSEGVIDIMGQHIWCCGVLERINGDNLNHGKVGLQLSSSNIASFVYQRQKKIVSTQRCFSVRIVDCCSSPAA